MRIALFSFVLLLSGISALVFETLWLRLAGLAFGNSVWSAALILSAFMAGLALGAAIAARINLRARRPLRIYALLEVVIAVLGCTLVFSIPALGQWLRPVFQLLWNHEAIMNVLRLVLSFLILVVPTTAMGLTLPVLLEDRALRAYRFGPVISLLYGCNTLGAVAGALLGEAWLIAAFGLWGTALAAAVLNLVAAAIAFFLARNESEAPVEAAAARGLTVPLTQSRLLLVSFGSGFLLLALEVVWFRFLRLYVSSSSTAFAVMLAVVLAGIGAGSVTAALVSHRTGRIFLLPILLLAAAMAGPGCYLLFSFPFLYGPDFYLDRWHEIALLSFVLMFPTSFLSGMLFPSVVTAIETARASRIKSAGLATLFNTVGAALGPLAASFFLIPLLGFQLTLVLCAAGYLILAALAIDRESFAVSRVRAALFGGGALTVLLVFVILTYRPNEKHFAHARQPFQKDDSHLVRKIEGTSDTLQLLRRDVYGAPYYYRLLTNAFTMSDTRYQNQRYMRLFGYLPLSVRPEATDALLICYGCGMTADALTHCARLQHIDIVDISKEVFALAHEYAGPNYSNPLGDGRVKRHVQDGRFFLQASPRQYDLITGEPPPPKVAGSVNLYTEEFFRLMHGRLKEGGLASFWLPVNQLKVNEARAILRAFQNVFANASVWSGPDYEWIMLGSKGAPAQASLTDNPLWQNAESRADLEHIGIDVPEQLPALFLMDGAELNEFTRSVAPLRDMFPKRLSDAPADLRASDQLVMEHLDAAKAARRIRASEFVSMVWPGIRDETLRPYLLARETRYASATRGTNKMAELDFYLRGTRLRGPILELLGTDPIRTGMAERIAAGRANPAPELLADLRAAALSRRDFPNTIRLLELAAAQGKAGESDLLLLTYLYCLTGSVDKAEHLAEKIGGAGKNPGKKWLWGMLQAEFGFRPPSF